MLTISIDTDSMPALKVVIAPKMQPPVCAQFEQLTIISDFCLLQPKVTQVAETSDAGQHLVIEGRFTNIKGSQPGQRLQHLGFFFA